VTDPPAADLLSVDGALLSRIHLRDLGWTRAQIDRIFGLLDVIVLPGSRKAMIRREDYLALLAQFTYDDNRVRP
jgi:hypothetical protein